MISMPMEFSGTTGYSNSINHWKYITGWLRGLDDDTVRSGKRLAMVPLAALDL
jgi:hypothetical protein